MLLTEVLPPWGNKKWSFSFYLSIMCFGMRCRVVSVTLGDKQNAQTTKKVLLADFHIAISF